LLRRGGAVTFEEFVGIEELPARRGGELEAFGRVDFPERTQNPVAEGVLRMAENVETADPATRGEEGEENV
jgi:hypothetical protein